MPITLADLTPELRLAAALDTSLRIILADMGSIRKSGAIVNLGTIDGSGSDVSRIRFAGLASDPFVTAADGATVAETALTVADSDITVVRGALVRELTDLANLTGFSDDVTPMALAQSMAWGYDRWFNGLVATTVATFGTDVGGATVDMSVDDYYDAIFTLELAVVPGPFYCLLSPNQLANLQNSLRAEAGAVQFMPATADMLKIKWGEGYAGEFLGVSIIKSSFVVSGGGSDNGGMWGLGAIGYKTGTVRPPIGAAVTSVDSEIIVEFNREAASGLTQIVGQGYAGVGLLEDARGVGIVTDAP